jgi:hypothetical protein
MRAIRCIPMVGNRRSASTVLQRQRAAVRIWPKPLLEREYIHAMPVSAMGRVHGGASLHAASGPLEKWLEDDRGFCAEFGVE